MADRRIVARLGLGALVLLISGVSGGCGKDEPTSQGTEGGAPAAGPDGSTGASLQTGGAAGTGAAATLTGGATLTTGGAGSGGTSQGTGAAPIGSGGTDPVSTTGSGGAGAVATGGVGATGVGGSPGPSEGGTGGSSGSSGGTGAASTGATAATSASGGTGGGSGGTSDGSGGVTGGSGGTTAGSGGSIAGSGGVGAQGSGGEQVAGAAGTSEATGGGTTEAGGNGGGDAVGGAGGEQASGGTGGTITDPDQRHLLLRDEASSQVHYVDLGNAQNNWHVDVPAGRDIQLVGDRRFLIGTETGYQERSLDDGSQVDELTGRQSIITARRLRNRNTILVTHTETEITLTEVDDSGGTVRTIVYPGFNYARLVRETPAGTFLITSDTKVIEGDTGGNVIWQATVANSEKPHAWMAVRLASGDTVLSTGYAQSLQIFSAASSLVQTITGPASVGPFFYSGFQVMEDGNYVVANWQGHADDLHVGVQVLEYDPAGNLVWSWQQEPFVTSLQGIIVLDGLDLEQLHVEGEDGALVPVP